MGIAGKSTRLLTLASVTFSLAGCSPDINSVLGIEDGKLDSFTCQMVMDEVTFLADSVGDANDYYDLVALEVVFDMAGDAFDIYASSETGAGRDWLRSLADKADAAGDEFGATEIDSDRTSAAVSEFVEEARRLSEFCG